MTTPESLFEDQPTGTFGHAEHRLPGHIRPWAPKEQARHFAELAEAISGWSVGAALNRRTEPRA